VEDDLCNEILPTRSNLHKKKIVEDDLCPICGQDQESTLHILWTCSSAIDAWSVGPRRFQIKHSMDFTKFVQLVDDVLDHCEQEEINFLLVLLGDSGYEGMMWCSMGYCFTLLLLCNNQW
jgi:hypothetical protein